MTPRTLAALTAADDPAALPRRNGELVFDAPWESRAFGIAVALHDAGAIDFEDFRTRLIEEIGRGGGDDAGGDYYERWLEALERLLVEQGVVTDAEIDARAETVAHDWAHDHDHLHADGA